MKKNCPYFSIIIPTKYQTHTLKHSVQTVLDQTFHDFEIIIADNSESDETQNSIQSINDDRIHYKKINGKLSLTENWEFALKFVTGKYTLFLGDDDGLSINALEVSHGHIQNLSLDVLFFEWASYNWPDQLDARIHANQIEVNFNDGFEGFLDSKDILKNVLNSQYYYHRLPTIYYSFFSSKLILDTIDSKGNFFHSVNPDVYSGIFACYFSKKVYKIRDVLGIRGTSSISGGAAFGYPNEKNQQIREEFIELNRNSEVGWNENVPFIVHSFAYIMESYFQLCDKFDIKIEQKQLFMFYFRLLRRIFFDNVFEKDKAKNEMEATKEAFKNNKKLSRITKGLLLFYNNKLIRDNEKRKINVSNTDGQMNNNKNSKKKNNILINGANFELTNISDVQLFLDKLLN